MHCNMPPAPGPQYSTTSATLYQLIQYSSFQHCQAVAAVLNTAPIVDADMTVQRCAPTEPAEDEIPISERPTLPAPAPEVRT